MKLSQPDLRRTKLLITTPPVSSQTSGLASAEARLPTKMACTTRLRVQVALVRAGAESGPGRLARGGLLAEPACGKLALRGCRSSRRAASAVPCSQRAHALQIWLAARRIGHRDEVRVAAQRTDHVAVAVPLQALRSVALRLVQHRAKTPQGVAVEHRDCRVSTWAIP